MFLFLFRSARELSVPLAVLLHVFNFSFDKYEIRCYRKNTELGTGGVPDSRSADAVLGKFLHP